MLCLAPAFPKAACSWSHASSSSEQTHSNLQGPSCEMHKLFTKQCWRGTPKAHLAHILRLPPWQASQWVQWKVKQILSPSMQTKKPRLWRSLWLNIMPGRWSGPQNRSRGMPMKKELLSDSSQIASETLCSMRDSNGWRSWSIFIPDVVVSQCLYNVCYTLNVLQHVISHLSNATRAPSPGSASTTRTHGNRRLSVGATSSPYTMRMNSH